MHAKYLRWLFLAVIVALTVVGYLSEPLIIGMSMEWSNGDYRCAGGTQPWALVMAGIVTVLYLLLVCSPQGNLAQPLTGVFRRFLAFWLDFILAFMILAPIVGILPTLMEWRRTGIFAWSFERTTLVSTDVWLSGLLGIVTFAGLAFYYAVPLVCRRPSPGSCIVGYQIVADDGVPLTLRRALRRTLLGFIAMFVAYLAPFVARDRKNGKFWLDKVFCTKAVKLS
jgi:uncharacterized RDD family membrane protein YckC